jgi:hypothetical protein
VIKRVKGIFGLGSEPPADTSGRLVSPPAPAAGTQDRRGPESESPNQPEAGAESPDATSAASEAVPADAPAVAADPAARASRSTSAWVLARALDEMDGQLRGNPVETPAGERAETPDASAQPPVPDTVFEGERSWFGDDEGAEPAKADHLQLAAEMGLEEFVQEYGGPVESSRVAAPPSTTADVFATLLAAEQSDEGSPVVFHTPPPELTDEMLTTIATRVVAGLQPERLHDELRRAVTAAVDGILRESVDPAVRGVVGLTVQKAVEDTLPAAVHHAVNEAVAKAVPEAVSQALAGAVGESLRDIVVETAERLVREEISRIREKSARD